MGGLPLRTPTHRRLGGPLPRQPANAPHGHPPPPQISRRRHAATAEYAVLVAVSRGYPPVGGRSHTCYSPVRRARCRAPAAPRLACVRPVASVHPEPGSNSPLLFMLFFLFLAVRRAEAPLWEPPGGRGNGRSPGPALLLGPFLSRFAPVLESTRTQAEASLLAPRTRPVSGSPAAASSLSYRL